MLLQKEVGKGGGNLEFLVSSRRSIGSPKGPDG